MAFDFDNLTVFLAVIDRGSFSAAARQLGRVPSAVSMAIANLEADVGLLLFDRSGREPKPTPHALSLVPQARLLIEQLRELDRHALSLTQGLETCLTLVVVPELLAATPWSAALATLSAEFPLLDVEVLAAPQADALGMVQDGRAQLALVFERFGMDAREGFQEVAQETLIAVISPAHPLLAREGRPAVRDEHLLSERQIIVAGRHTADVDKRIAISRHQWRTDNPVAALQMVVAGLGWAWLPQGFVRAPLASGQLVAIPSENFTNVLELWVDVVWAKSHPPGLAMRRFIELMSAQRTEEA
jgi:DNA-binding transcriptional LysR family regulator